MDLPILEDEAVPLPPREIRFRWAKAKPYEDRKRVRIEFEVTPFLKRPDIEVTILNAGGETLASASIIESVEPRASLTLHLRGDVVPGTYQGRLKLTYPDLGQIDEHELSITIA